MLFLCRIEWFIKSRTALELQRRCNSLIVCIEEEKNEQKDQSKIDKKKLNKGLKEKSEEKNEKTGNEEKTEKKVEDVNKMELE